MTVSVRPPPTSRPDWRATRGRSNEVVHELCGDLEPDRPAYQPSSSAAVGERAERMSRVEVTLANNTDRYINFGDQFMTQVQVDGARTMPVIDIANNVGIGPRLEAVAPGASTTFSVAWALPERSVSISLELAPLSFRGDGGQPVAWTGDA